MVSEKFPRSIQAVERDEFFEIRRSVKEIRPVKFRALRIGDTYVVVYSDRDGNKWHAVVGPGYTVKSYENWAEALETLVAVLRDNAGAKVELVEVEAAEYVLQVEERNIHTGEVSSAEECVVEWGDGAYSIDAEVAPEGP